MHLWLLLLHGEHTQGRDGAGIGSIILVYCNTGILEYKNSGIMEYRKNGIQYFFFKGIFFLSDSYSVSEYQEVRMMMMMMIMIMMV